MQEIILPFSIRYDGKDADDHVIDALQFGQSLTGAARLYKATAHYCAFGKVPNGNYKKQFNCYVTAQNKGCYEAYIVVAALAQQNHLLGELSKDALSYVFFQTIAALKKLWVTKQPDSVVKELAEALTDIAKENAEVSKVLANGLVQSNNNLASLHGRLIDTLPELAATCRNNARDLVVPIGQSCDTLSQFHGTPNVCEITEPEAEAIRSKGELEVEEMERFTCHNITEINRTTGHCEMVVDGFSGTIKGKITDPALSEPGNIYTHSMDQQTPFEFSAKPVKKNGSIHRLYISDANADA